MSSEPAGEPQPSESLPGEPQPGEPQSGELPTAPAQAATVLAGNLHPAVLLLRLVEALRQSLLLAILGIVADRWILVGALLVFLVHLGHGLVRYLTFHYRLTTVELVTREGILNRQERRIPIDRIQDLGFEATLLRRAFGITVVRVETASGQGAEAVLDSLGRGDAERLRHELLQHRQQRSDAAVATPLAPAPVVEPEWTVCTAQWGQLLLRGLTDLRIGALVVAAFGASELANQLGLVASLAGAGDSFLAWLRAFPMAVGALLLVLLVVTALGASVAASALGNVMVFHGFRLSLRGDTLLCRYGLLTTRQKTLPRQRIQRVRVEQTWLRRLLGVATARADSAGAGRGTGAEAPGGFDVVVPLARATEIDGLLPALLPGFVADSAPQRSSPRLWLRVFLKGLVATGALALVVGPFAGFQVLWLACVVPVALLVGILKGRTIAFALWPQHLFLRFGVLGRYQVLMPTAKVQAVSVQRGPLQRLLGLCDLAVFAAGGPPTRIPDLELADAQPLLRELARRACEASRRDWRNEVAPARRRV